MRAIYFFRTIRTARTFHPNFPKEVTHAESAFGSCSGIALLSVVLHLVRTNPDTTICIQPASCAKGGVSEAQWVRTGSVGANGEADRLRPSVFWAGFDQ